MSSKDNNEEIAIHSKNDNIKIMINDKADEVTEELFQSLLSRYQIRLETSIKAVILYLIELIYCITNVIKYVFNMVDHI